MRYYNQGSGFAVTVSRDDIWDFASQWPCCDIPDDNPITFHFERNGDLVDITTGRHGTLDYDGPDLLALSQDAQEYGEQRHAARKR